MLLIRLHPTIGIQSIEGVVSSLAVLLGGIPEKYVPWLQGTIRVF
jgi:hypothetical protein